MDTHLHAFPDWHDAVKAEIASLRKFYAVETDEALILAQAQHIERLQAKLPPNNQRAFTRVREG